MRDRGDKCHRPTRHEDGSGGCAVVEMRDADDIRIVGEEHVARPQRFGREAGQDRVDEAERRAKMHGCMGGERERAAIEPADGGGTVRTLLDIGRIGRADEAGAHLLSGRLERAPHDLRSSGTLRHGRAASTP